MNYYIEMASSCVRYGVGVTSEIGPELKDQKYKNVLLVSLHIDITYHYISLVNHL